MRHDDILCLPIQMYNATSPANNSLTLFVYRVQLATAAPDTKPKPASMPIPPSHAPNTQAPLDTAAHSGPEPLQSAQPTEYAPGKNTVPTLRVKNTCTAYTNSTQSKAVIRDATPGKHAMFQDHWILTTAPGSYSTTLHSGRRHYKLWRAIIQFSSHHYTFYPHDWIKTGISTMLELDNTETRIVAAWGAMAGLDVFDINTHQGHQICSRVVHGRNRTGTIPNFLVILHPRTKASIDPLAYTDSVWPSMSYVHEWVRDLEHVATYDHEHLCIRMGGPQVKFCSN